MASAFGLVTLPASSRHTQGRAVDMDIGWNGDLAIRTKSGPTRAITSNPRSGMNLDLQEVGASYGVLKAAFADVRPTGRMMDISRLTRQIGQISREADSAKLWVTSIPYRKCARRSA